MGVGRNEKVLGNGGLVAHGGHGGDLHTIGKQRRFSVVIRFLHYLPLERTELTGQFRQQVLLSGEIKGQITGADPQGFGNMAAVGGGISLFQEKLHALLHDQFPSGPVLRVCSLHAVTS